VTSQVADLTTIFVAERSRLLRLIGRIIGDRTIAEDIVQETYLKVSVAATQTVVEDHRGYLVRAATNLAFDHVRRNRTQRLTADAEHDLLSLDDGAGTPETAFAARQALATVTATLDRLPERTRRAFELHRFGERTMAEIGRELGISTTLVHKLVTEAYTAMRDDLRGGGFLSSSPENSDR